MKIKLVKTIAVLLLFTILFLSLYSCIYPLDNGYESKTEEERTMNVHPNWKPPSDSTDTDDVGTTTPDESGTTENAPPTITTQRGETTTEQPPEVTTTEDETTTEQPPEVTTTEDETTTEVPGVIPPPTDRPIKIYIDQGHNPHSWNTGAEGNGLKEQDITYTVGVLLAEMLSQNPRYEVRLSRPTADTVLGTDNNSALDARVNDANAWGADYFISLHANSFEDANTSGAEAYVCSPENGGYALGNEILDAICTATGLRNRGMKINDYRVLKKTAMPSTLIEMGFITNVNDAALMGEHPELFATAIYNGIDTYFGDFFAAEPTAR